METNTLNAKILIVDDHGPNVLLLTKLLKAHGYYNLIDTVDVRNMFTLYHQEKPDLILLDLKMPYMDGFDILDQLERFEEKPTTPIIIITSHHEMKNEEKALRYGVHDFIAKPFDVRDVIQRIQYTLEKARA